MSNDLLEALDHVDVTRYLCSEDLRPSELKFIPFLLICVILISTSNKIFFVFLAECVEVCSQVACSCSSSLHGLYRSALCNCVWKWTVIDCSVCFLPARRHAIDAVLCPCLSVHDSVVMAFSFHLFFATDVKKGFYVFYFGHVFTFLNVFFIFQTFFYCSSIIMCNV